MNVFLFVFTNKSTNLSPMSQKLSVVGREFTVVLKLTEELVVSTHMHGTVSYSIRCSDLKLQI